MDSLPLSLLFAFLTKNVPDPAVLTSRTKFFFEGDAMFLKLCSMIEKYTIIPQIVPDFWSCGIIN